MAKSSHTYPRPRTESRPIPRERITSLRKARSQVRPFRSPKDIISKGVQALSGFLSNISNNFYLNIEGNLQKEELSDTLTRFLILQQKFSLYCMRSSEHFEEPETQRQLLSYSEQAKHHVSLFENTIRDLKGNPQHFSSKSQTFRQWLDLHLKIQSSADFQEVMDFENLFFLSSLQVNSWETLNEILPFCQDDHTKASIQNLVDECEDDIKEQNQWIRRSLTRQILKNLVLPVGRSQAA